MLKCVPERILNFSRIRHLKTNAFPCPGIPSGPGCCAEFVCGFLKPHHFLARGLDVTHGVPVPPRAHAPCRKAMWLWAGCFCRPLGPRGHSRFIKPARMFGPGADRNASLRLRDKRKGKSSAFCLELTCSCLFLAMSGNPNSLGSVPWPSVLYLTHTLHCEREASTCTHVGADTHTDIHRLFPYNFHTEPIQSVPVYCFSELWKNIFRVS